MTPAIARRGKVLLIYIAMVDCAQLVDQLLQIIMVASETDIALKQVDDLTVTLNLLLGSLTLAGQLHQ